EWFGRPLVFVPKRFVIQRFYEWGQVDLLPVFEWQGLEYLEPDAFWDGVKTGADGIPRPRLAHDAFIVWMTGLLWGARYNPRYDGLIRRAAEEDREAFAKCAVEAFGEGLGRQLLTFADQGEPQRALALVGSLRRALMLSRWREDAAGAVKRQVLHWRTELEHHVRPPFPWIAFLGPDGSGKSTVIDGFLARLQPSRIKVMQAHW